MKRFAVFVLICCLLTGCAACAAQESGGDGVRLIALNCDKADCLLLLADGAACLIDTGYEYTWNLLHEALRQYGVTRLDAVFLTHCDKDHAGGLSRLSQSGVGVDAWYASAFYNGVTESEHPAVLAAAEQGATVRFLRAGDTVSLPGDIAVRVVGPLRADPDNENNNSLVFYMDTKDGTLLFTGDMKLGEEYDLLSEGLVGPADLLKVPFHGDNTASSDAFVERVRPAAALICTSSAQEPDTPASSVVKRYQRAGAEVYVTQDYVRGVELTLQSGRVSAAAIRWNLPDYSAAVRAAIDRGQDLLTLTNAARADISLAGWTVFSTKGEECVFLPDDAVLPAGGQFTLGTRTTDGETDVRLDVKRLWHKSKYDQCLLYDSHGALVTVTDNGAGE